jgi:hypothetical protein
MDNCCGVTALLTLLLWWMGWIAACSIMINYDNTPIEVQADLNYIYQVGTDWDTKPFVDMTVTTSAKCPSTHPDEVIYDLWNGATILCDCIERSGEVFRDIKCSKGKNGAHNGEDCWE